jgi:chemotaxis protein histidine kinase CheA
MTEPQVESIYKGGGRHTETRDAKQLIEIEWKLIDKLIQMAENTHSENKRAFYYQTLAAHVRTLSMLLKLHGTKTDTEDLAQLLSQIQTNAKTLAKRLQQCNKH